MTDERFRLYNQPETITSLAARYNVSRRSFRKWIKPIENKIRIAHRHTFSPADLRIILDFLGEYCLERKERIS